jgi:hypothetical protein
MNKPARAYKLWKQVGKPESRAEEFWHLAEQDVVKENRAALRRMTEHH